MTTSSGRVIAPGERLEGARLSLRLVTLDDCGPRYVAWLADPEVNRFLETRRREQTLESIRAFVSGMLASEHSYLFAILERAADRHVGNIKVGPIDAVHAFADVSYFLGERAAWGKGYATEAITLATRFAFERLGLHRVQAGIYRRNVGSGKALEKAGYAYEGCFVGQLRADGGWEDHLWYGAVRESWRPPGS